VTCACEAENTRRILVECFFGSGCFQGKELWDQRIEMELAEGGV
jgi:hypothetical protein